MRTVYNQYDSFVRPLRKWLLDRGVTFQFETTVTDIKLVEPNGIKTVTGISCRHAGRDQTIAIEPDDFVIVTLGSMTEASSLGSMDAAPLLLGKDDGGAWALWEKLALGRPEFGRPAAFADHVGESKWLSFTTTLFDPTFLRLLGELTGNVPGEGGLITFPDSNWLASIVVPNQPHFIGQPADVAVFWGYGLSVDKPGNFVAKPMSACTGREIMTEILGHLRFADDAEAIIDHAICIPCMMPFITSQFLAREHGDRPQVIPANTKNLAFVGQFCELPYDVVFTVEYSIRSAQVAAYALLGIKREPPAVYKGAFDPRVLYKAFRALHAIHG
jgi:oleate hydratase